MFQTLHACENGDLYQVELDSVSDIADLVQEDCLESLTSTDRTIDFWLTPALRGIHRSVNRTATELFLATTRFDAHTVPLLRGNVVLASHDGGGNLAGLADAQIRWLVNSEPTRSEEWTLGRRFSSDERGQHRTTKSDSAHRNSLRRLWRSMH